MRTVTATFAKRNFLRLLNEVVAGERFRITRYGKPFAIFEGIASTPPSTDVPRPRADQTNAAGGTP